MGSGLSKKLGVVCDGTDTLSAERSPASTELHILSTRHHINSDDSELTVPGFGPKESLVDKVYCRSYPRSRARHQAELAAADGYTERQTYIEGFEGHTFQAALEAFRGSGRLVLYGGLRVLTGAGKDGKRSEIVERVDALHKAGVVAYDPKTGENSREHGLAMLDKAMRKINGEKRMDNPEELGRLGGKAKGKKAADARALKDAMMRRGVEKRGQVLTWPLLAYIFDESKATMQRHYGGYERKPTRRPSRRKK